MRTASILFGQKLPPLTLALKRLIRDYPKGLGTVKELIQNADDAQAQVLRLTLDNRQYPRNQLPVSDMASLQGPALLAYNDALFTDEDFDGIQRISQSVKELTPKTGRFGLGFNSVYNITDFPCLLSRDWLFLFDPHCRFTPHSSPTSPGCGWHLRDLWDEAPDLLMPFLAGGLTIGQAEFAGTLFRFPLRDASQASVSEISTEPFSTADFMSIVGQAAALGPELFLFLKNLERLEIGLVDARGATTEILRIETTNLDAVRQARAHIRGAAETFASQAELGASKNVDVCYVHEQRQMHEGIVREEHWAIAGGVYAGAAHELVSAALRMRDLHEKAIPLADVAVRLYCQIQTSKRQPRQLADIPEGRVFCSLPLPITTPFPFHVNGYFDLDSTRHALTTKESNLTGDQEHRIRWNELLVEHGVVPACARLLTAIRGQVPDPSAYYARWPRTMPASSPFEGLARAVYTRLRDQPVLAVDAAPGWVAPKDIVTLPSEWQKIHEPLAADGVVLPSPPLPGWIRSGFADAKVKITELTPVDLRQRLRTQKDVNSALNDAPRACLRRRQWVIELLRFCLKDAASDLSGLPLALTADGCLHSFGMLKTGPTFLAGDVERKIFASFPYWFLDAEFVEATGLGETPAAQVRRMTLANFIECLHVAVDRSKANQSLAWDPDALGEPNGGWLVDVFAYLSRHAADIPQKNILEALRRIPLIPDQHEHLRCPGRPSTPLLPTSINSQQTRHLTHLGVALVTAPQNLMAAIRELAAASPHTLVPLSGPALVDALALRFADEQPPDDEAAIEAAVDFLAQPVWADAIQEKNCRRTLRALPIFRCIDGTYGPLDHDVFSPVDDEDLPAIRGTMQLLRIKNADHRRFLERTLGVERLDRGRVIVNVLLPAYGTLSPDDQRAALEWISYHLPKAQQDIGPDRAQAMWSALRDAALIRCEDGSVRPANQTYDPSSEVVRDVLGDLAAYPDMTFYHSTRPIVWNRLFADLGMNESPTAHDILRCIDNRAVECTAGVPKTVVRALRTIAEHLVTHWAKFRDVQVDDSQNKSVPFVEALHQRAWLTCRDVSELRRYPAAVASDDRLYRADELQTVENASLCASQCPIAALPGELLAKVSDDWGFPAAPGADVVLRHFDALLAAVADNTVPASPLFLTSMRAVYHYLGEHVGDSSTVIEPESDAIDPNALRTRYEKTPCILIDGQLWRPVHVFEAPVSFLDPYRIRVRDHVDAVDRGLGALGRRQSPGTRDYLLFLSEMAERAGGGPLPAHDVTCALRVLTRLTEELVNLPDDAQVPLLTREGQLCPSNAVFMADAPLLEGQLDPRAISLAHHQVPDELLLHLRVRRLSRDVIESPDAAMQPSKEKDVLDNCQRLQDLMRSPEFRVAVLRLMRDQSAEGPLAKIDWLADVRLHAVHAMQTSLYIKEQGSDVLVGRGDGTIYSDRRTNELFIDDGAPELLDAFLADAINVRLEPTRLTDTAKLMKALGAKPEGLERLLDRLKVAKNSQSEFVDDLPPPEPDDRSLPAFDETLGEPALAVEHDDPDAPEGFEEVADSQPQTSMDDEAADANGRLGQANPADAQERPRSAPVDGAAGGRPSRSGRSSRRSFGPSDSRREPRVAPDRPANGASAGRIHSPEDSGPRGRAVSYAISSTGLPSPHRDDQNDERPGAMEIGDAAVLRVLEHERRAGRAPTRMAHNSPGYDVSSVGGADTRLIEVKGIDGPWSDYGVPLSPTQLSFAREHGPRYWLYVVEFARDDQRFRVHEIKDPFHKISQFRFDQGWRQWADGSAAAPASAEPQVGMMIELPTYGQGAITQVAGAGIVKQLTVRLKDGGEMRVVYNPTTMRLGAEHSDG